MTTERLVLRPPSAADLGGFLAFATEVETMRHLGGVQGRHAAWRAACAMAGAWEMRGFGMFSVLLRGTGEWIGRIGPWQPEGWPVREIGWGIRRAYTGKGYAREAAVASISFAFDTLGWERVDHVIAPDNVASIALAERIGSRRVGPVSLPAPLERYEAYAYGQTRGEWRARS